MRAPLPVVVLVPFAGLVASACGPASLEASSSWPRPRIRVVETKTLPIDRIYRSMTGPFDQFAIDTDGMDWVTSVHTEVIDVASQRDMGGEFFCHSQLSVPGGMRLAVNATGGEHVALPEGFGLPVASIVDSLPEGKDHVTWFGMVLNNNFPDMDRDVRIRATIEYLNDEDLAPGQRVKPLYYKDLTIWVDDICEYVPPADGAQVHDDVATHCVLVGDENVHWMVPPGRQVTRRTLTKVVPVPSTVHFAQAHLHNHGRYVRLTDKTTGEVLWQSDVDYMPERVQISRIASFSSVEGFPVEPDHEYELEALYDNTSDADVDAMAVMYLYFTPRDGQPLRLDRRRPGRRRQGREAGALRCAGRPARRRTRGAGG